MDSHFAQKALAAGRHAARIVRGISVPDGFRRQLERTVCDDYLASNRMLTAERARELVAQVKAA